MTTKSVSYIRGLSTAVAAAALLALAAPAFAAPADDLVAAAKKEGQLTVIALPRDWCGYGAIIDGFKAKHGLAVNELNPDAGAVDVDGRRLTTRRDLNGVKPGDVLPMALRPEALRIGDGGGGRNTLAGVVEDVAFLGAVARTRVRLAQAAVIVDTFNSGAGELPGRGAPIVVNFAGDDLIPLQPA
jgi:hypothetical protein